MWQNVKNIQQYIAGPFSSYFDQLQKEAQEKTDQITLYVNKLKEKGVDLKELIEAGFESADQDVEDEDSEQEEVSEEGSSIGWLMGWLAWLRSILWWPIQKLIDIWHNFFG